MGTSRSNSGWTARALVYSGRPAPAWRVRETEALALVALWDALPEASSTVPESPALGYRGCELEDGAGNGWRAHDGVASSTSGMTRVDAERRFERAILATAPEDLLPAGIVP